MFCIVPHGGRQMFLPVDPKRLRVPMSDLSTLFSGTSVHPSDRCLTTLWSLGARASRDTDSCRSWDPAYVAPTLLVVNDAQGLVGT